MKHYNEVRKYGAKIGAASLGFFSFGALAEEPAYTTITAAVSFANVITAVLAIGALVALVYVAMKGVKLVLRGLKGA